MVYFKHIDSNGFVSVSTLNADDGGNSTRAEHDTIAGMYRNAEAGYGVMETESGFVYALRPVPDEPIAEDAALTRYANEITGATDETIEDAAETLIKITMEGK